MPIDVYELLPVLGAVAELWERHAPQQPDDPLTVVLPIDSLGEIPSGAVDLIATRPYVESISVGRQQVPTFYGQEMTWAYRVTFKPWHTVPLDDRYPLPKRIREHIASLGGFD